MNAPLSFLNLSNIEFDENSNKDAIYLNFHVKNKGDFFITRLRKENHWNLEGIHHDWTKAKDRLDRCSLCNGRIYEAEICKVLNEYLAPIYEEVKKHPNVRLKLLFL